MLVKTETAISTHTPHKGCDKVVMVENNRYVDFNSHTPQGVRPYLPCSRLHRRFISTHTPHKGCDALSRRHNIKIMGISTHTPHKGCDQTVYKCLQCGYLFQLTHPTRGATHSINHQIGCIAISTHTPHKGCDSIYSAKIEPPPISGADKTI